MSEISIGAMRAVAATMTPEQLLDAALRRADTLAAKQRATREPTISEDVVEWATSAFWIPELRGPIELYPYQCAVMREARRKDASGNFIYSTVLWSDIKKSAKSTIAAIVALHTAQLAEFATIYIVANDLKQASSRVGEYLSRAVEKSPILKQQCRSIPSRNRVEVTDKNSVIEFIPIDPTGEAGSNADLIIFSELWGAHHEAQKRMWAEMTLSPTKFGKSQRWIETYAGYHGESELLWSLYEQGVQKGRQLTLYDDDGKAIDGLEVYANDAARMLCLWNTKPRLPWQTPQYYAQESASLEATPNEYSRMHGNQWVSSTDVFVDIAVWDKWIVSDIPPLDKRTPIILGVDAAEKGDCFAIVGVSRWPQGSKNLAVRYCRIWYPPKGGKIDFRGTDSNPGPITILKQLIENHYILCMAYDPAKLELAAQDMQSLAWLYEFSQAGMREESDKFLRDCILNGRVVHTGDAGLREHMTNARAQATGKDKEHIRIVKGGSGKIDATVALSMASYMCVKNINL